MTEIVIHNIETNEVVHRIDVAGKSSRAVERIERGLAINFDFTNYYWTIE